MKPTVWHLICRSPEDWHLEQRGELLARFDHKDDAIREAAWRARQIEDAQLMIHRADGTIERELRFGPESRRSR
jgi:hypothetical protein